MNFTLSAATYRRWLAIAKDPAYRQGFTVGPVRGNVLLVWLLTDY